MEASAVSIPLTCKHCRAPVEVTYFYCPACGKKIKDKPVSVSFTAQLIAYAVSVFLPPLGLIYTVKYLKQSETKAKTIGWITLILTVISIAVTVKITMDMLAAINGITNMQMQDYSNLGL